MKKWIQEQKQYKDERGLTLVELLAVIVILAIVATIAFIAIGNVMENSKKDALISNAQQMIDSAKLYETTEGKTLDSSTGVSYKTLHDEDFIETIYGPWEKEPLPVDDSTGKVTKDDGEYSVELTADGNKVEGTEDDIMKGDRDELFD